MKMVKEPRVFWVSIEFTIGLQNILVSSYSLIRKADVFSGCEYKRQENLATTKSLSALNCLYEIFSHSLESLNGK